MLYMIVNTHNPESCAFRTESDGEILESAFDRFEEVAREHDVKLQASWVNAPSHEIFMLVEAEAAHSIDRSLIDCGLLGRTHSRVLSVVPTKDLEVTHVH